ncbi:protein NipSnap homolog, partial [Stylophora pistillata]
MAAIIGSGLRGLRGLRQTVGRQVALGTWLHGQMLSTSPIFGQATGSPKIYEMRTYYVKPKAFDSYTQKMEAQKSLLQDETWVNNYRKKILKMLVKQDNLVMNPCPWFDVKPPLSIGGVYELCMYDLILGKKEQWEHRFIQGFFERCKLSEPVGVWFTEFGPINR